MFARIFLLLLFFRSFEIPLTGQIKISDIANETRIAKNTKKYILRYQIKGDEFFSELQQSEIHTGYTHVAEYYYPLTKNELLDACFRTDLSNLWNSRILHLNLVYNKQTDSLCFVSPGTNLLLDENQIIFVTLRYLAGFFKLDTALKVTLLDRENGILEFCYLKGGKSEGRQQLRFVESANGGTIIEHRTHYRSRSKFRDKRLYPYFHTLAIDELHANLKKFSTQP